MNNTTSFRSPKNKFFADVRLIDECFAGGSNYMTYGAASLEACKKGVESHLKAIFGHTPAANVDIRSNNLEYPSFDWLKVESYAIGR